MLQRFGEPGFDAIDRRRDRNDVFVYLGGALWFSDPLEQCASGQHGGQIMRIDGQRPRQRCHLALHIAHGAIGDGQIERDNGIGRVGKRGPFQQTARRVGVLAVEPVLTEMQQCPRMIRRDSQELFPNACRIVQPPGLHEVAGCACKLVDTPVVHP